MKISFINPYKYGLPNIGLAYVISAVEKAGHHSYLIDLCFNKQNDIRYVIQKIEEQRPEIIGFSTCTLSYQKCREIAKVIRAKLPKILLVWGGIQPTILPEETIKDSLVDVLCIGEGELTFPMFLNRLSQNKETLIPGIWYKKNGNIIRTHPNHFIENLDSVPFPNWVHWEMEKYFKSGSVPGNLLILTSRGCSFDCSFCSADSIRKSCKGKYYRTRSAENIIREIELNLNIYGRKLTTVLFGDEVFGFNRELFKDLMALYVKRGLHKRLPWMCQTRADIITEEWARSANRAGCIFISTGLETGNEKMREKTFNKGISNGAFIRAINNLHKHNIFFSISLMFGAPEDNKKTIKESIDFANSLAPFSIKISRYIPLPTTKLCETLREKGLIRLDKGCKDTLPCYDTFYLKSEQIDNIFFYIHIKMAIRYLKVAFLTMGWRFFIELLKFILNIDKSREMPLNIKQMSNKGAIVQRIVFKYLIKKNLHLITPLMYKQ